MNSDSLKKEAEEWLDDERKYIIEDDEGFLINISKNVKEAYLAGAEPREKRIAELEKENAELKTDNVEWEKASDKWKSLYDSTNNQLTKAKEIIKIMKYLLFDVWGYIDFPFEERVNKFLSEVEK